jgi:hypothetical protein
MEVIVNQESPSRDPRNVPGPFYAQTYLCLACGLPEAEAPDLLAELNEGNYATYFVRQPETPDEIERACKAIGVCCVNALRYGGTDPSIIRRLGNTADYCDHLIDVSGDVVPVRFKPDDCALPPQPSSVWRALWRRWRFWKWQAP